MPSLRRPDQLNFMHRALMGTKQPALGQRNNPVDMWQNVVRVSSFNA